MPAFRDDQFEIHGSADHTKRVWVSASGLTTGTKRTMTVPDKDITIAGLSDISQAFPIGSVFIAVVSTNPGTLLGYGTWSAFGAGRVMVGLDSGDTDFDTVEETGGAKAVAGAGTNSAPTFTGAAVAAASTQATPDLVTVDVLGTGVSPVTTATGTVSAPTFTGSATSVVQPYIVCYFWKRTA